MREHLLPKLQLTEETLCGSGGEMRVSGWGGNLACVGMVLFLHLKRFW